MEGIEVICATFVLDINEDEDGIGGKMLIQALSFKFQRALQLQLQLKLAPFSLNSTR